MTPKTMVYRAVNGEAGLNVRENPDSTVILGTLKDGEFVELDVDRPAVNGYVRIWSSARGAGWVKAQFLCAAPPSESSQAKGNTERALAVAGGPAVPPGGPLTIGQQRRVDGHVWQLCEQLSIVDGDFWRCRLVSKSEKSPNILGEHQVLTGLLLERGEDVSHQSFEEDQRASSRRELDLRDECGNLATQLRETRVTLAISADALADIMAWLGPSKVREFEKWRTKTRK